MIVLAQSKIQNMDFSSIKKQIQEKTAEAKKAFKQKTQDGGKTLKQTAEEGAKKVKESAEVWAKKFLESPVWESSKKLRNRWGNVVNSVLKYIPQPITDTAGKIFSEENKEQLLNSIDGIKKQFGSLFSSLKDEDIINLAVEDLPCAVISNIVYDDPFSRPRQIYSYKLVENHNNIEHCIYRDEKQKKLILGFRGTEATEAKDYISDVNILLWTTMFNERFQQSLEIYKDVVKEFPEDIRVITWHSLGWSICYMIAQLESPDRTVVFNPWASANATFVRMFADTEKKVDWTRKVFTYRISGDPISTLSVVWYTRSFKRATLHPGQLHTIGNFMPEGWEEETKKLLESVEGGAEKQSTSTTETQIETPSTTSEENN